MWESWCKRQIEDNYFCEICFYWKSVWRIRTRQLFDDDLSLEQHGIHSECQLYLLDTAKEIWEAVCDTYSMKKNVSRVFEIYEDLLVSDKATRV